MLRLADPADSCGCGVCGSFGGCSFSCNPDAAENKTGRFHKCPAADASTIVPVRGRPVLEHMSEEMLASTAAAAGTGDVSPSPRLPVSEDCLFINVYTASDVRAVRVGPRSTTEMVSLLG